MTYVELSAVQLTWAYIGQQCVYAGLPLGVDTPAGSPAEYLPEPELNVSITSSWLAKQVED